MKLSYKWLKELADLPWTADEASEKLAQLGFPVERSTSLGIRVSNVVSAKILSISKHPNADRLQIAQVTDGKSERTVVCGAPNIAVGQVVPLAIPGAKLPGGFEIAISKIRGVESQGMLCSERELGLSEEHAGILQLPATAPLGKEIKEIFGGDDTILEIEVTPNRPDVLSHIGIARELAALAQKPLKLPFSKLPKPAAQKPPKIKIQDPLKCYRYIGRVVQGVKIGPSPDWMVQRLKACGIRSINNIVDITNYVLLEWGHPLHAFDLNKLKGPEIIVRNAAAGESIVALDEKTYKLQTSDLVIADAENPVAIAGIMGGSGSGVTESTVNLLLESAVFERTLIRSTSRRLALRSESSLRFEKGTNADSAEQAADRALHLILELAGGRHMGTADVYPTTEKIQSVQLREKRLTQLIGAQIKPAVTEGILKRLELKPVKFTAGWKCTPPAFRKDIVEEVDLVEEVLRMVGYNSFEAPLTPFKKGSVPEKFQPLRLEAIEQFLKGIGVTETISSSFCARNFALSFGINEKSLVPISNPLSHDDEILRPYVSVNNVKAAVHNSNHQRQSVALFEIGTAFHSDAGKPVEIKKLAIVMAGTHQQKTWNASEKIVDIYALKGVVENLASVLKLDLKLDTQVSVPFLHPNQSFSIHYRGQNIGWGGMSHPEFSRKIDIALPLGLIELSIDHLELKSKAVAVKPLPKFSFVERDIAVVVDKSVSWKMIEDQTKKAAGSLLIDLYPFDIFSGESLGEGRKSIAFRMKLQHPDHTLSDAEITGVVEKVKSALQQNCGAALR